jgi:Cu(I)/Ag(I) efflux system protein CusF
MNKLALALGFALVATGEIAQAATHEHHMSQHLAASQVSQSAHTGIGVLKEINEKSGKVRIAHEAIAELGWPAMTMWFALRDPLPQDLKIGDAVRFQLMQGEKKQWLIIKIERK